MKISVSLPADDVAALDEHVRKEGLASRSAAIQQAVRLLRQSGLEDSYAAAWDEWEQSAEREEWDSAAGDGMG